MSFLGGLLSAITAARKPRSTVQSGPQSRMLAVEAHVLAEELDRLLLEQAPDALPAAMTLDRLRHLTADEVKTLVLGAGEAAQVG